MDSATREQSLTVQQAVPSVRALQTEPETLTPIRHGFIWKRSRLFKQWLSRWAQLDARGFVYATNPKLVGTEGKPVLPSEVAEVVELPAQHFTNGAVMYGIRVVGASGASKDLYSDDKEVLDAWAADLARCTAAARQRRAAKARSSTASSPAPIAAANAAAALMATPSGRQLVAAAALRNAHGELILSDFCEVDWSRMLGSGLFACVLRGRMHDSGEAVAVKIIKAEAYKEYMEMVKREAVVWSAVGHHPHIVHLKQVLESRTRMYFIAELCEGGGLVERLAGSATYCEREVGWLAEQLLTAVAHLHANAIVHMDIKPDNLVFASRHEDSVVKLIDFSLSSFFYTPTDPGGTPDFVAPELLKDQEQYCKHGCGPEVDMWAVGVMLFFLLSGQTPFQASSLEQVLERVKAAEWAFHGRRWAMVSEGAKDLVSRLLRRDPGARLSAQEALEHPWLRRYEAQSQALLQEAVVSFKTAAAATQAQMRNSWVKQGTSDDLLTTRGTLHTNVSPHNSAGQATSAPAVPDTQFLAPNAPAGSFSAAASGSRLIPAGAPAGSGASGTHSFTHRPGFGPQPKSPARSPHNSPSAAPCSPRSPLGLSVRTRRASDTMAYVLALTERQESLTQAQAQGLPPPPVASMDPAVASSYARAKARRASDLMTYSNGSSTGSAAGPTQQGTSTGSSPANSAKADAAARSPLSAPGGVGPGSSRHRGTSGLSVVTTATSLPPQGGLSAGDLGPITAASRSRGTSNPGMRLSSGLHTARLSNTSRPSTSPRPSHAPRSSSPMPTASSLPVPSSSSLATWGNAAPLATLPPADQAMLQAYSASKARTGSAAKSHSYNEMPAAWLEGHPAHRPATTHGQATPRGVPSLGSAAGLAHAALQRRSSTSFTAGTMPHGPSPLSMVSGTHRLPEGVEPHVQPPPGSGSAGRTGGAGTGAGTSSAGDGSRLGTSVGREGSGPGSQHQRIIGSLSQHNSASPHATSPLASPTASGLQAYALPAGSSVAGAPVTVLESMHDNLYQAVMGGNLSQTSHTHEAARGEGSKHADPQTTGASATRERFLLPPDQGRRTSLELAAALARAAGGSAGSSGGGAGRPGAAGALAVAASGSPVRGSHGGRTSTTAPSHVTDAGGNTISHTRTSGTHPQDTLASQLGSEVVSEQHLADPGRERSVSTLNIAIRGAQSSFLSHSHAATAATTLLGASPGASARGSPASPGTGHEPLPPMPTLHPGASVQLPSTAATAGLQAAELAADGSRLPLPQLQGHGFGSLTQQAVGVQEAALSMRTTSRAEASMQAQLETIPSDDPESLSGVLRSIREDGDRGKGPPELRSGGGPGAGAGGPGGSSRSSLSTEARTSVERASNGIVIGSGTAASRVRSEADAGGGVDGTGAGEGPEAAWDGPGGVASNVRPASRQPSNRARAAALSVEIPERGSASSGVVMLSPTELGPGMGQQHVLGALSSHAYGRTTGVRRASTASNLRQTATTAAAAQVVAAAIQRGNFGGGVLRVGSSSGDGEDRPLSGPQPETAKLSSPGGAQGAVSGPDSGPLPGRASSSQSVFKSNIPLRGASLSMLVEQAAPLAAAAKAAAAAQLAGNMGSSAGSSQSNHPRNLLAIVEPTDGGDRTSSRALPRAVSQPTSPRSRPRRMATDSSLTGGGGQPALPAQGNATPGALPGPSVMLTHSRSARQSSGNGSGRMSKSNSVHSLQSLLAQAAPLAAAAQAAAAAQLSNSRTGSYNGSAAAGHSRLSGSGRSSPRGSGSGLPTPTSASALAVAPGAAAPDAAAAEGGGGGGGGGLVAASWVAAAHVGRRSVTASDLNDRVHRAPAPVHRLASQGQAGSMAATTYLQSLTAIAGGMSSGGGGGGGGPLYSSAPTGGGDTGPPAAMGSTTRLGGGYPTVPSRLSNTGTGTANRAIVGLPGAGAAVPTGGSGGVSPRADAGGAGVFHPGDQRRAMAGASGGAAGAGAGLTAYQQQQLAQMQQLAQLQQFHQQQQMLYNAQQRSRKSMLSGGGGQFAPGSLAAAGAAAFEAAGGSVDSSQGRQTGGVPSRRSEDNRR